MTKFFSFPRFTFFNGNIAKTAYVTAFAFISLFISTVCNADNHSPEQAKEYQLDIQVTEAWARATFALAKTGAAYFTLSNQSDQEIRLISASVDHNIASMTQLHHTIMEDSMMQMQELEEGVLIGPNEKVSFSPGGKHIMLMGLTGPLNKGEKIAITLVFSNHMSITHTFPVLDKR